MCSLPQHDTTRHGYTTTVRGLFRGPNKSGWLVSSGSGWSGLVWPRETKEIPPTTVELSSSAASFFLVLLLRSFCLKYTTQSQQARPRQNTPTNHARKVSVSISGFRTGVCVLVVVCGGLITAIHPPIELSADTHRCRKLCQPTQTPPSRGSPFTITTVFITE